MIDKTIEVQKVLAHQRFISSKQSDQTLTPPSYGKVGESLKNQPFQFGHVGFHQAPRKVTNSQNCQDHLLRSFSNKYFFSTVSHEKKDGPKNGCFRVYVAGMSFYNPPVMLEFFEINHKDPVMNQPGRGSGLTSIVHLHGGPKTPRTLGSCGGCPS